jgi:outer membrane scaffolding protein for murein synthesis (MipA/OmpV family)
MKSLKLLLIITACIVPIAALGANNIDIQPIPDLPLKNTPPPSSADAAPQNQLWQVSLGGGMSYGPRYDGAANDRLRFVPLLDASYNNGKFFFSPLRGIGYNFSSNKEAQYGVRLALGHARNESADPHLKGMGDITYVPETGLFFNQRLGLTYVSGGVTTGSHGSHIELGSGVGFPLGKSDRLRLGFNLNWGDKQYVQTYYGITTAQAAASGYALTAHEAGAGIMDYALTSNWAHNYDRSWFSNAGVSYKLLTGSAQYSPLTLRSATTSMNFLVGYRF